MMHEKINNAANWVCSRGVAFFNGSSDTIHTSIYNTLSLFRLLVERCPAPILLKNPFMGRRIEILIVPKIRQDSYTVPADTESFLNGKEIDETALAAIEQAISSRFTETRLDVMTIEDDFGNEVFIFEAGARDLVLRATGVVILEAVGVQ